MASLQGIWNMYKVKIFHRKGMVKTRGENKKNKKVHTLFKIEMRTTDILNLSEVEMKVMQWLIPKRNGIFT